MPGWNASEIPDQSGRTAVVTGANSGIGYVTARELARRGASVVLACRSAARGRAAVVRLHAEVPGAEVEFIPLDLADLASVREFATSYGQRRTSLDLLVNNAGVMALPYGRTADGFETQFGVNHLGHFALTGLLLPRLRAAAPGPGSSTSPAASTHWGGSTSRAAAWMRSPASTATAAGSPTAAPRPPTCCSRTSWPAASPPCGSTVTAAAAHPGYASSNLHSGASKLEGPTLNSRVAAFGNAVVAQPTSAGALPTLYAATAPGVGQDAFIGPWFGWRGAPAAVLAGEVDPRRHVRRTALGGLREAHRSLVRVPAALIRAGLTCHPRVTSRRGRRPAPGEPCAEPLRPGTRRPHRSSRPPPPPRCSSARRPRRCPDLRAPGGPRRTRTSTSGSARARRTGPARSRPAVHLGDHGTSCADDLVARAAVAGDPHTDRAGTRTSGFRGDDGGRMQVTWTVLGP